MHHVVVVQVVQPRTRLPEIVSGGDLSQPAKAFTSDENELQLFHG